MPIGEGAHMRLITSPAEPGHNFLHKDDAYGIVNIIIAPGEVVDFHKAGRHVVAVGVTGVVKFSSLDEDFMLVPGAVVDMPAGTEHRLEGLEDSSVMVINFVEQA